MKRVAYRVLLSFLGCLIVGQAWVPNVIRADAMYSTYTKDNYGGIVFTQPAYIPIDVLGKDLVVPNAQDVEEVVFSPLRQPGDLFIDDRDHLYVADSGNNRIVHYDEQFHFVRYITLEDDPFSNPQGVFVDGEGHIYVADTGNNRVVHLDAAGHIVHIFYKPESRYVPEDLKFDPTKLVVDRRGYLYVVTLGGYRGMIQLDGKGNFQSFYGANLTPFSVLDAVKKMMYSREMYSNEMSKLPPSINNIALDRAGFLFTVTDAAPDHPVKRLDMRGTNILPQPTQGEYVKKTYAEGKALPPLLQDVAIDRYGNIATIDSRYNYISHYDPDGNLLYFWGGRSSPSVSQMGMIKNPAAIGFNSKNQLFILDDQEGVVQVFELSEFGSLIQQANQLTINGFYEESEPYWQQVLQFNSRFAPAIEGMGKAAYKKGQYELAVQYFQRVGNQTGYSDAFWQLRLQWFQDKFSLFATLFVLLSIGYLTGKRLYRLRPARWKRLLPDIRLEFMVHLKHALYILKHPIDGFTAIRHENKGGLVSAAVLLLFMLCALLFHNYYTSFAFNPNKGQAVHIADTVIQFMSVWFGWVVCNHLISSIYRGEGRFKDVFVGSAYALMPFILVSIPLSIVSNVFTLSEETIYHYVLYGIYTWVAAMFFWKVQSIQNYSVGETILNISLSLFSMLVLGVLVFIIFSLSNELRVFVYEVYQEVLLR